MVPMTIIDFPRRGALAVASEPEIISSGFDRRLEEMATATKFAVAIKTGFIDEELVKLACDYLDRGEPVKRYANGKPVE
jgi:hypothetical protein